MANFSADEYFLDIGYKVIPQSPILVLSPLYRSEYNPIASQGILNKARIKNKKNVNRFSHL